jgi:hypothetical protein
VDALTAVDNHPAVKAAAWPIRTLFLTQSFRFGPEIGFVANSCLDVLKGVHSPPLFGGKQADCITGGASGQSPEGSKKMAILGRTNARLFQVRQILLKFWYRYTSNLLKFLEN